MKCPCCGGEVDELSLERLLYLPYSPVLMTVIRRMVKSHPIGVSMDTLLFEVYGANGNQPENASNCISLAMLRLRKKIEPLGWTVPKGTGGRDHGQLYRLVRL